MWISSSIGFCMLVLLQDVDLAAVVECTGAQCSEATRNAALHLLANLTSLRPEKALGITLQVISLCQSWP